MYRPIALTLVAAALGLPAPLSAKNAIQVPADYPTIQEAVDAANDGDQIRVGPGEWCGATITKRVDLFGQGGATIVGCPAPSPALGLFRIGFFLPTAAASGTTIRHFIFDGRGVSNVPPGFFDPLAFAVFAREASYVVVEQNRILGTVQGVTNTGGSGWTVSHNVIEELTVFTCDGVITCGGGDGIVMQERDTGGPRATDNTVTFNVIAGAIPDNLDLFDMVGIVLFGQDGAVVKNNRLAIPDNPSAGGDGNGILVADSCCGSGSSFLTTINSLIVNNDGRQSEFSVVIVLDSDGGTGNSAGTTLRGNFGVNVINGGGPEDVRNRSVHTLDVFP
jgi:hypothetical protein